MNTIVVGVDGTRPSLAALRFAIGEARLHGDRVKAVIAWHVPPTAYGGGFAPTTPEVGTFERAAEETLAEALAAVADEVQDVQVESAVREGDAAHVLVEEAEGAAQLVVGCRHFGLAGKLFHHSVSGECVHEAHCPVTVVPES